MCQKKNSIRWSDGPMVSQQAVRTAEIGVQNIMSETGEKGVLHGRMQAPQRCEALEVGASALAGQATRGQSEQPSFRAAEAIATRQEQAR